MDIWQKSLREAIILQNRGKVHEDGIKFKQIFGKHLSPSQLIGKLETANQAKSLYTRAQRIVDLLKETAGDEEEQDINYLNHILNSSVKRINDIIKILESKIGDWGFKNKEDEDIDTVLEEYSKLSHQPTEYSPTVTMHSDFNRAKDVNPDKLKSEIKNSLKALSNILDYMDTKNLLRIQRELDKIVGY